MGTWHAGLICQVHLQILTILPMKLFNQYFVNTLKTQYADFAGKATRSQYWYFVLFYIILAVVFQLIDELVINPMLGSGTSSVGGFLQMIFALALIIPSIAIGVRRLHDIGKSGLWLLIGLIPLIGSLILLFFFVQKSK